MDKWKKDYNVIITRENNKYNKRLLWRVVGESQNTGAKFIDWCLSLNKALNKYRDYNIIEINKKLKNNK